MKNYYLSLKNEYLETRSHPHEEFIEWLIKRKMSWGMRWCLVLVLMFVVQPLTFHPLFLLYCFYLGSALFLIYYLGHLFFALKALYQKLTRR